MQTRHWVPAPIGASFDINYTGFHIQFYLTFTVEPRLTVTLLLRPFYTGPNKSSFSYSGTPPYGHPVNTVTLLLQPLYSGPNKSSVSYSGTPPYGHPVNTVTLLLQPLYSGPNKSSFSYSGTPPYGQCYHS